MIAVIVPAHNEEEHIVSCLHSVQVAAWEMRLHGEEVRVFVVLDACTDRTELLARECGATTIAVHARNVGRARAAGAQAALQAGARWLAFTDADTEVDACWLSAQLALVSDAVCGTIAVRDWGSYGERMRRHFQATYTDADGHRHIHGANLGVKAEAYSRCGGFKPLASSEDVDLVHALERQGSSIAWSSAPRVFTSARRRFRAPGGFGATLVDVDAHQAAQAC